MRAATKGSLLGAAAWLLCSPVFAQQVADPDFKPAIAEPAYAAGRGPTVVIDEAHNNFHTMGGRYRPFADLLLLDGYAVRSSARPFDSKMLADVDVLVMANAQAALGAASAVTNEECDAIEKWLRDGGSLLLIADHAPFGAAVEKLAVRFSVTMGKGWVFEPTATAITTQLVFSRENGRLGEHPVMQGRNPRERVQAVKTFTGQSLSVPDGAHALLKFGTDAREVANTNDLDAEAEARAGKRAATGRAVAVAERVQGLAMSVGKGRLVVLGEAAMFSAQVATLTQEGRPVHIKAGMNVAGFDDQQFALNVMHWLSGILN